MGLLGRFAEVLEAFWIVFGSLLTAFWSFGEVIWGHLGPWQGVVACACENDVFTSILSIQKVILGGFRLGNLIGIYEGFGFRRPFYVGIYEKIVKSSGKTCVEAS